MGGIPALANLTSSDRIFETVYKENLSTQNEEMIVPKSVVRVGEGELYLPEFYNTVKSLHQVVDVDYTIPGCPPEPHQIWAVLEVVVAALLQGAPLPPKGAVVGASDRAVCEECSLEKHEKAIERFYRPYEIVPQAGLCLLEQGLVCLGPATRGGCGALCPTVGIGCRGCYGPMSGVQDQGARMLSAIASVISAGSAKEDEHATTQKVIEAVNTLADPAGTFYRFGMSSSTLGRAHVNGNHHRKEKRYGTH
jgi:F420-non-reducing hydrogenase small subunit